MTLAQWASDSRGWRQVPTRSPSWFCMLVLRVGPRVGAHPLPQAPIWPWLAAALFQQQGNPLSRSLAVSLLVASGEFWERCPWQCRRRLVGCPFRLDDPPLGLLISYRALLSKLEFVARCSLVVHFARLPLIRDRPWARRWCSKMTNIVTVLSQILRQGKQLNTKAAQYYIRWGFVW